MTRGVAVLTTASMVLFLSGRSLWRPQLCPYLAARLVQLGCVVERVLDAAHRVRVHPRRLVHRRRDRAHPRTGRAVPRLAVPELLGAATDEGHRTLQRPRGVFQLLSRVLRHALA